MSLVLHLHRCERLLVRLGAIQRTMSKVLLHRKPLSVVSSTASSASTRYVRIIEDSLNAFDVHLRCAPSLSSLRVEIAGRAHLKPAVKALELILQQHQESQIIKEFASNHDIPNVVVYQIHFPLDSGVPTVSTKPAVVATPLHGKKRSAPLWTTVGIGSSALLVYTLLSTTW